MTISCYSGEIYIAYLGLHYTEQVSLTLSLKYVKNCKLQRYSDKLPCK